MRYQYMLGLEQRGTIALSLAAIITPPVATVIAVKLFGPFHAGWVPIAWVGGGAIAVFVGIVVARAVWDEFGAGWAYVAFLMTFASIASLPWIVGLMGGWTK
ncbi:MAG: hypothetical protein U0640_00955 [Phycisphaerales bacterium]